jgi:hypothetical protein
VSVLSQGNFVVNDDRDTRSGRWHACLADVFASATYHVPAYSYNNLVQDVKVDTGKHADHVYTQLI